jgi:hypothetical protein
MAVALNRQAISVRQANSDDMAGKITYIAPVEKASGKIFGRKSRFVAVTRKKGIINGCAVTGVRSTPMTQLEKKRHKKFGDVAKATRARLISPSQAATDKAAYAAVKDQYNSLYHYVFRQVWDAYVEQ